MSQDLFERSTCNAKGPACEIAKGVGSGVLWNHNAAHRARERSKTELVPCRTLSCRHGPVGHDNVGRACHQRDAASLRVGELERLQDKSMLRIKMIAQDDIGNPLHRAKL
jgi:hypothetical protein